MDLPEMLQKFRGGKEKKKNQEGPGSCKGQEKCAQKGQK